MRKPITAISGNIVVEDTGSASLDLIQTSALVRIAQASEAMAKLTPKLMNDLAYYQSRCRQLNDEIAALSRSNSALRGQITRLKKKNTNGTRK